MDPLTLLALAKASYEAVKGGIAVGKENQKDKEQDKDSYCHRPYTHPNLVDILINKSNILICHQYPLRNSIGGFYWNRDFNNMLG